MSPSRGIRNEHSGAGSIGVSGGLYCSEVECSDGEREHHPGDSCARYFHDYLLVRPCPLIRRVQTDQRRSSLTPAQ